MKNLKKQWAKQNSYISKTKICDKKEILPSSNKQIINLSSIYSIMKQLNNNTKKITEIKYYKRKRQK